MKYEEFASPNIEQLGLYGFDDRMVHPFAPEKDRLTLPEIGRTLSNICRFGGRLTKFYSVAQHSVLVALYLEEDRDLARAGLLHDAGEFYWHDDPKPVKRHMPAREELERQAAREVMRQHDVDPDLLDHPDLVKADAVLAATEIRTFYPKHPIMITEEPDPEIIPDPRGPEAAYAAFATMAADLFPDRYAREHFDLAV